MRSACPVVILLSAALLGISPVQAADFQSADRIVAVVGARSPGPGVRMILASDVDLRARLALLAEGDPDALSRALPDSLRHAVRGQLVGEMMLAAEAERLSMAKPAQRDRELSLSRLATSVGGEAALMQALAQLGVAADELTALLDLRASVAGFLEANLEQVVVSDAEVAAAHADPAHGYHDAPLPRVRDRVRAALQQEHMETAVASWVNTLMQRIPYRILVD